MGRLNCEKFIISILIVQSLWLMRRNSKISINSVLTLYIININRRPAGHLEHPLAKNQNVHFACIGHAPPSQRRVKGTFAAIVKVCRVVD